MVERSRNDFRDYLAHHGIRGMKWGKRNGPPYPLDYDAHSKAEKRLMDANKKTVASSGTVDRLKYKATQALVKMGLKKVDASMQSFGEHPFLDFVNDVKQEENIANGKNVLDALTRRVQAGYDQAGNVHMYSYDGKYEPSVSPMKVDRHFDDIGSNDMAILNKGNGTNNCVACALAGELAVQGYKGITSGVSKFGNSDYIVEDMFPGSKIERISNIGSDMDSWVKNKYGNGSSGYFAGSYSVTDSSGSSRRTGGHALHWNITTNGEVRVQDGQNGRKFTSFLDACDYYGFDKEMTSSIARLDNHKPDFNKLVSNGLISPNFNKIDNIDTSQYQSFRSYGGKYHSEYDTARKQSVSDLYEKYKEYKRSQL